MTPARVYLETTMFSFYYETREFPPYPEYKAQVRRIFDMVKAGVYEPFTSLYALNEIAKEADREKRGKMTALVTEYGVKVLDETDEVTRMTTLYIQEGTVSPAWTTDAAHIAMTTVNGLDFIVSLNFTHIARPWTVERVRRVNRREGYQGIGIYRPSEVLESEDDTGIHE
jgi:hypothetical protein